VRLLEVAAVAFPPLFATRALGILFHHIEIRLPLRTLAQQLQRSPEGTGESWVLLVLLIDRCPWPRAASDAPDA